MGRRIKRPPLEIFTLSFLDIISCAFGAVVMLVLLSKNGDHNAPPSSDAIDISTILQQVLSAQQAEQTLQGALTTQEQQLRAAQDQAAANEEQSDALAQEIPRAQASLIKLNAQAQSIRDEIDAANALLNVPNTTQEPDEDVGGVPTDAEYVVFIIDNSGSMVDNVGWDRVISVVEDVITNHPKLKGFNVMAADGRFIKMRPGGWIEDGFANRARALTNLRSFRGGGSQPEKGILKAIDTYKNTKGKVSLYVFGDEFSSSNLKRAVERISRANLDPATDKGRFRIHGVGFYCDPCTNTRQQFAIFMKSLASNNRGAFIALPKRI